MAKVESNTGVLPLVLYPAVFPLRGENTGLPGDPNALRGRREGGREKVKMADGGPFSFWSGGGGGGGGGPPPPPPPPPPTQGRESKPSTVHVL